MKIESLGLTSRQKETRAKLQLGASSPGAKQYGDGRTNQPTDQPTDKVSHRGACFRLKTWLTISDAEVLKFLALPLPLPP
jgi:hypothetical protein